MQATAFSAIAAPFVVPKARASAPKASMAASLSSKTAVAPVFSCRQARRAAFRAQTKVMAKGAGNSAAGKTSGAAPVEKPKPPQLEATNVMKAEKPMKIVFVSTEVAPWSKTGGLGDVVGSLPIELAKRGHKVMSVSPRYDQYKGAWDTSVTTEVMGETVGFFHEKKMGVDRVFVDHPDFLAKVWGKTGSKLYGKKSGADFMDNQERFALFNHAALEACKVLPFGFGEDVIFVANDWHSALVPVLLKTKYQPAGEFADAKCALCIHNIAFQGRFWPTPMASLGLPEEAAELFQFSDGYPKVYSEITPAADKAEEPTGEIYNKINWLQAGLKTADKNLTVSPNYATELMSGEDKGVEMDSVITAMGGIEGIVNGMDPTEWNPAADKFLDVPYDEETVTEGKAAAKQMLQAEAGLDLDPEAPLFGYIGRLEEQKGVDIMLEAIPKLLEEVPNAQVVVLGTGKAKMEAQVELMDALPSAAGIVKFSSPIAHMITAGADFLMVPSRFEPCGLIQLHAMQYGTVPVVASTGGLVDTVKEGVTGFHMGALDADDLVEEDVDAMVATCKRAAEVFDTPAYGEMVSACIAQDLSWAKPAQKWEAILEEMVEGSAETTLKKQEVITPKELVETTMAQA